MYQHLYKISANYQLLGNIKHYEEQKYKREANDEFIWFF